MIELSLVLQLGGMHSEFSLTITSCQGSVMDKKFLKSINLGYLGSVIHKDILRLLLIDIKQNDKNWGGVSRFLHNTHVPFN